MLNRREIIPAMFGGLASSFGIARQKSDLEVIRSASTPLQGTIMLSGKCVRSVGEEMSLYKTTLEAIKEWNRIFEPPQILP